jgi:sulfatase maturation enzyme AslB (radical SAM superfamily)
MDKKLFCKKLLIELTQKCNFNCKYCFYNDIKKDSSELSLTLLKKALHYTPNANNFYLSGGEPLLNKNFKEIVSYLKKRGKIFLFTNASLIDEKVDAKFIFENFDLVFISLDTLTLRNNNYRPFSNKILKKIINFNKYSDKICIKITLTNQNLHNFFKLVRYLKKRGFCKFSINFAHNISSNKINFEINNKKNISKIFNFISKNKNIFYQKEYLEKLEKLLVCDISPYKSCCAGEEFIFIDCHGNILNCPEIGNEKINKEKCFSKRCISLWEFF